MKETKDNSIRIRLTNSEKQRILDYCEKHNLTISEFIRFACNKIFEGD